METADVSAILFAKELKKVAAFYAQALGMTCTRSDDQHVILNCRGFDLIVHQIPKHIADSIVIEQPPHRRVESALRLNFPCAKCRGNAPPGQEPGRRSG